jgi:hypothetical protein
LRDELFLCQTLPITPNQALDLVSYCWHPGENLYQGYIPKEKLTFSGCREVYNDLQNYINNSKWNVDVSTVPKWDADFDNELENWVKFVWLTAEYLTKGFRNPVGAHYNPRLDKNVIHPGGCRQHVLDLFHKGSISAIYFNTGGVKPIWLHKLEKVSITSLLDQGWDFNLVADHSSLIPHLLKDLESIVIGKKQTHIKIQENLSDLSFISNEKVDILAKWQIKDKRKARFRLNMIGSNHTKNVVKAAACMLNDYNFSDDDIQIIKEWN